MIFFYADFFYRRAMSPAVTKEKAKTEKRKKVIAISRIVNNGESSIVL